MATPFDAFRAKLGIGNQSQRGVGYNYSPTILQQGNNPGDAFANKLTSRKDAGNSIYNSNKQQDLNRLASDLTNKSAGLKFDEFGKPDIQLADFGQAGNTVLKGISRRGDLSTQAAESRQAYQNAVTAQNLGQYGFTGSVQVSGTDIPGASSNNPGARAASMAMQVAKNHTAYVYGGNSLSTGIDCSGLVQQIYRQLGINVPRTTWEQAKNGREVPVSDIRPGDLVFYNDYGHVGIYVGNGKIVHAANSRLGVITSNLNNSNGSPLKVLRPY
jgi:cell wall-associated NlpC family hydrolase